MSDIDHTRDCVLPSDGRAEGLVKASELFALSAERDALTARVAELEGALKEAGRVLDWAARKMKGNCAGSDINTVMMAAGRTAEARAALTQPIAAFLAAQEPLGAECERVWDANADKLYEGAGAPSAWRPIETAPKDGTRLLLAYQTPYKKWRRVVAFYAPKLAIETNSDDGGDWHDYDEANDRYCLPEGWYECIENWDDYSSVHMSGVEPTHWMPLPPPPEKGGE